jgi:hypothetical protein
MTPTPTARLFKLAPDLWAKLEAIAAANGTLAATGPTAGQPSVHALLGAIAAGDLVVLDKDDLRCISAKWDDFGEELARVGVFQD